MKKKKETHFSRKIKKSENEKKRNEKNRNKGEKKRKEASKGYLPRAQKKKDFCLRNGIRNREANEAKKKSVFQHPRKENDKRTKRKQN